MTLKETVYGGWKGGSRGRGDIYIYIYIHTHTHTAMTDTQCIAETSTMQSNYPIKKKK